MLIRALVYQRADQSRLSAKINTPGHVITRHVLSGAYLLPLLTTIFLHRHRTDSHHSLLFSRVSDMWVLESDGDLLEGMST